MTGACTPQSWPPLQIRVSVCLFSENWLLHIYQLAKLTIPSLPCPEPGAHAGPTGTQQQLSAPLLACRQPRPCPLESLNGNQTSVHGAHVCAHKHTHTPKDSLCCCCCLDYENPFLKAVDSKTRKGSSWKKQQESLGSLGGHSKGGFGDRVEEISLEPAASCPLPFPTRACEERSGGRRRAW